MSVYDSIKAQTVLCLISALHELNCEVVLNFTKGTYLHDNRNFVVDEAIKNKATHLMFVDADVTFPPYAIKQLLLHDKDIIGGMYHLKRLPLVDTIKFADENGELVDRTIVIPEKIFKCAVIPAGFMLIKLSCLGQIRRPYFEFGVEADGTSITGEDVMFCKKARKAGLEIWCDPTIPMKHIGDYLY